MTMPPKKRSSRGAAQQNTTAAAAALQQLEQARTPRTISTQERALLLAAAQAAAAKIVEDAQAVKAAAAEEAATTVEDAKEVGKAATAEEAAQIVEDAKAAAVAEAATIVEEAKATAAEEIEEMKAAAASEIEEMKRMIHADREEEKAAMEKAHDFQRNRILLNVGGHRFETSRQTLTEVPGTYLELMFSGRFELTPDADSSYFIDRDGRQFHHILNFLRDAGMAKLSSAVLAQNGETGACGGGEGLRLARPYDALLCAGASWAVAPDPRVSCRDDGRAADGGGAGSDPDLYYGGHHAFPR